MLRKIIPGDENSLHLRQMRLNALAERKSVERLEHDIANQDIDIPVAVDPFDRLVTGRGHAKCAPPAFLQPRCQTDSEARLVIDD